MVRKLMCKQRAESCLKIGTPRGPLRDIEGTWDWKFYGCSVDYSIHTTSSELRVTFPGLHAEQRIPLIYTTPHYGGIRWWFLCPKCTRRVSLLYKPSNAECFFCRHCHDLSYESTQM